MAKRVLILIAATLLLGLAAAQDEDETITPEELEADMKEQVGMSHLFRDIVAHIYRDRKQYPDYLKFDTEHVRCRYLIEDESDKRLIGEWSRGEVDEIEEMADKFKDKSLKLLWTIYFSEIQPQIINVEGKVVEPDESGGFEFMFIFEVSGLTRVKYYRKEK